MNKTAALLAASAVAVSGFAIATNPAQADGIENEKTKRCSAGSFAQLSLEKEFGRIDVDFDIENASPRGVWMVRVKHNGKRILKTQRVADYEGELDVSANVKDKAGKDRFIARAKGPGGEVCRVKLGI